MKTIEILIKRDISRLYNLIKYRRCIATGISDGIDYDVHNLPNNAYLLRTEEDIKVAIRALYFKLNNAKYGTYIMSQL